MESQADRMICDILVEDIQVPEEKPTDLQYFSIVQYYCYLGIKYLKLQNYEEAINNFILASKEKSLSDLEEGTQIQKN